MSGLASRARALLPAAFHFTKVDERCGAVNAVCLCGHLLACSPTIIETGSSIELRCPQCRRYIQLRASYATDAINSPDAMLRKG